MSRTVEEVMNREVFTLSPHERAADATKYLVSLGITGCPVISPERQPLGHVSLRDLVDVNDTEQVKDRMTSPARTIAQSDTISEAARTLAAQGLHRLVVTDDDGCTVGVISAVDVIRGLLGLPKRHPQAFPHFDARHEVTWTDELPLDLRAVDEMPEGGGILTLIYGPPGESDRVVWAEETTDLGKRFIEMISAPQATPLSHWLETHHVRARVAPMNEVEHRAHLTNQLRRVMPTSREVMPRPNAEVGI